MQTFSKETANYVVHQAAVLWRLSLRAWTEAAFLVPSLSHWSLVASCYCLFFSPKQNYECDLPIFLHCLRCWMLVKLQSHPSCRGLQHLEVPAVSILSLREAPQRDKERQQQVARETLQMTTTWLDMLDYSGHKDFSSCSHLYTLFQTL